MGSIGIFLNSLRHADRTENSSLYEAIEGVQTLKFSNGNFTVTLSM